MEGFITVIVAASEVIVPPYSVSELCETRRDFERVRAIVR